ncbi:MAG: hypothetical protein Q9201_001698 [Fulgogasparrea decipioides]
MANTAVALDVADPSDWLNSPAPKLAPVEAALRCQVCKDFFDTPMITSCSHTFCSLCIRRCLTNDGKCPVCRAPDQELRLRRNWTVEEIVDAFQAARPSLTSLASHDFDQAKFKRVRGKSYLEETDLEEDVAEPQIVAHRAKTRSQSRQSLDNPTAAICSPSADDVIQPNATAAPPDDGLAECPICGLKMKEEAVFLHLDTHSTPDGTMASKLGKRRRSPSVEIVGKTRPKLKPPERLPQLNYSLMKDNALRKKLSELGIPNSGSRTLLVRRHAEWVNIVNANADSSRPKSKREMLRELDVWDRSTGRSIANSGVDSSYPGSIMSKDFDGTAWSLNHNSDFQDLVSKARIAGKANNSSRKDQTPTQSTPEQEDASVNISAAGMLPSLNAPDEPRSTFISS